MRTHFKITKKDLDISFFSGHGAGGQHRNRHMNCVRMKHRDTGVMVTGQSYREKSKNIEEALRNLAKHPKIRSYCYLKLREIERGKSLDQLVEESMDIKNLLIEGKDDSEKWVVLQ